MVAFLAVVLMLFLIPGPAVIITVTQTIKGGLKNGIITALGIGVGDLIHTIAAVCGLSAILMSSAFAFEVVKYLGAAYLIYLGINTILNKTKGIKEQEEKSVVKWSGTHSFFRQALVTEILNPKTALFFLAFLPQFVTSDGYPVTVQLLILGMVFVFLSVLYTILLALLTHAIGEKISVRSGSRWLEKSVGLVYIGLGIRLAFQTQE